MATERDFTDDWTETIGRYITGFALVELLVYELYDILPTDKLSRHGRSHRDYSDRTRFLQALLKLSNWPQSADLDALLDKTFELATLRNQLAHNPMFIEVRLDDSDEHYCAKPVITDSKKGHNLGHITLEYLQATLDELNTVSTKLRELVHEIKTDDA